MDRLDLLYLKTESSKILTVSFVMRFYLEMMHSKIYRMIHQGETETGKLNISQT